MTQSKLINKIKRKRSAKSARRRIKISLLQMDSKKHSKQSISLLG